MTWMSVWTNSFQAQYQKGVRALIVEDSRIRPTFLKGDVDGTEEGDLLGFEGSVVHYRCAD